MAATVLSRLPYRAGTLYNWDAVQLVLALEEYDVAKHQPHPPGYILYVGLGRLINAWLADPAAAYVLIAVIFSGLTTFVVYYLGLVIYDRTTAIAAASTLAASPLFWFYGSVGLTYAGEALGASTVAYFSYRALNGSERGAWMAAGCLGLAGGLRQSLLALLLPLWLVATIAGPRRVRTVVVGLAVLAFVVSAWLLPMLWLTGGVHRYLAASRELGATVLGTTSVAAGSLEGVARSSRHLVESVIVGLGPLALAAALLPWYGRRYGWRRPEWFLLGWMAVPALVYVLVHFGQAGYVLTFLPGLVILLSRVLITAVGEAARRLPAWRRAAATPVVVGIVVLANGVFFIGAPVLPRDDDGARPAWMKALQVEASEWIFGRTAAALREHEAVVHTFVDAIRSRYGPAETVVLTELGNPRSYPWLRHAMYYLPEYLVYELQVGDRPPGYYAPRHAEAMAHVPASVIPVPPSARRLVWFVDHWSPHAERPPGLEEIELPHGRSLYALPLTELPRTYSRYTFVGGNPRRRARAGR